MKQKRYSEEQIIQILKEAEAGMPVADVCRKHGVSDASFYTWRRKYGGMNVSEVKRLKRLEEENRQLKRLLAETMLEKTALEDVIHNSSEAGAETPAIACVTGRLPGEHPAGL